MPNARLASHDPIITNDSVELAMTARNRAYLVSTFAVATLSIVALSN